MPASWPTFILSFALRIPCLVRSPFQKFLFMIFQFQSTFVISCFILFKFSFLYCLSFTFSFFFLSFFPFSFLFSFFRSSFSWLTVGRPQADAVDAVPRTLAIHGAVGLGRIARVVKEVAQMGAAGPAHHLVVGLSAGAGRARE